VKTRLPKYKDFFIDAANKNNIEPSLLAAQSYQESHWDRKAKSPTGVRGIMMLTQPVAKSLGVTNRLHAEQNIFAGAKFQAKMKKMVEDVDEPDRSWLALAAYNVGRGHFRDAQSLARKLNKNPDRWAEMKEVLPLLSQKKYYKDLRYGYARGNEPVRYVTRIRNYNELLHQHFAGIIKQQ
jgi:membrane-bound lytic murein transglycosylase F